MFGSPNRKVGCFAIYISTFMSCICRNGKIMGSITGVPASTLANKFWLVFEAFGDIAFAYPYSIIVLEIQVWSTIS